MVEKRVSCAQPALGVQEAIRKAKFKDGKSNRQIASELGISRNTVKKVVTQAQVTVPEYKRSKPIQAPVMGSFIQAWLEEDNRAPRKLKWFREFRQNLHLRTL